MMQEPNISRMRKLFEKYMLLIGVMGQAGLMIQALRIYWYQNSEGVSLIGFIFILVSLVSWFIYGILLRDRALIISNVIGAFAAGAVVVGVLSY